MVVTRKHSVLLGFVADGNEGQENGSPYVRNGGRGLTPSFPSLSFQSLLLAVFFALLTFLGTGQQTYTLYLVGGGRLVPRQHDRKCVQGLASRLYGTGNAP